MAANSKNEKNEKEAMRLVGYDPCAGLVARTGTRESGYAFKANIVQEQILTKAWKVHILEKYMDAKDAMNDALKELEIASGEVSKAMLKFKSTAQNDISSIKSHIDKVRNEVTKLKIEAEAAVSVMNSAEMKQAVNNAERLSVALKSLNEVNSGKISFAVFGAEK